MRLNWKIILALGLTGLVGVGLLSRPGNHLRKEVEATRHRLRQQGFKTDLVEFDFFTSNEARAREAALRAAPTIRHSVLLPLVEPDTAIVVWKQPKMEEFQIEQMPALDEALNAPALNAACAAALEGPISFDLDARQGSALMLSHLASLRNLAEGLGSRVLVKLREGRMDEAWTNWLAATRLVTAWTPEPVEISHMVWFQCAATMYNLTWQALQADGWSDERLSQLQQEWERVDFLRGLPDTTAYVRASAVETCRLERQQPPVPAPSLKDLFRSPRHSYSALTGYWRQIRYRRYGTFENERALLLHYRDREVELRHAIHAANWAQMRQLPGVTNLVPFQSRLSHGAQVLLNHKQLLLAWQGRGVGLAGRAAEAETRRRILLTALALERFRLRYQAYPHALNELAHKPLGQHPVDFMDGQPLRYRLAEDAHFVLYSVGFDCVDDGGKVPQSRIPGIPNAGLEDVGLLAGVDLVWPRPTSAAELAALRAARIQRQQEELALDRQRAATFEQQRESARRAAVQKLLAQKPPPRDKEPTYNGRPLAEVLRGTARGSKGAKPTLDKLLTLRQIEMGEEAEIAVFELPMPYDVVTNVGELRLLVDVDPHEEAGETWGERQECRRATNGNCLLVWNTAYDPPGQHALQASLTYSDPKSTEGDSEVKGPVMPYLSTNALQFDVLSGAFGSKGALLRARLREPRGDYSIELTSLTGEHLITFKGSTTNGIVEVHWDLTDDRGRPYTNESFKSAFNITFPESGHAHVQKGP